MDLLQFGTIVAVVMACAGIVGGLLDEVRPGLGRETFSHLVPRFGGRSRATVGA